MRDRVTGMGAGPDDQESADPLALLADRVDLSVVPFTDRGSRLLVFLDADRTRFHIRLCERWPRLDYVEGDYRARRPLVKDLHLTDGDGHPLPLTVHTAPHRLDLVTPRGTSAVVFADPEVLLLTLPEGRVGVRCAVRAEWAATDARGARFRGARNVALTTNARIEQATVDRQGLYYLVDLRVDAGSWAAVSLNITPRLGFSRTLHPQQAIQESERQWRRWFEAVPPVHPRYHHAYFYAWWVMRAGLISSRYYLTREAMVPSKVRYVGVWQWDAFFHALAYRYVDTRLAADQFRIFIDHQRPDGMLPDAVHDEGVIDHLAYPVDAPVTKPPLAAWAAWKVYEVTGDADFLAEVYAPLGQWAEWWFAHSDQDRDGVPDYGHPYSSGMDDSPLWDEGMPVESPDLATYLVLHMDALSRMARTLGLDADAARWAERADGLTRLMAEHFYDPASGLFWAVRPTRDHRRVEVLTPVSLLPLATGRLGRTVADRLVAHLVDPAHFWPRFPIPTVARSDPRYTPTQMWRGPTWANINYLFVEALLAAGFPDVARALADRTLQMAGGYWDLPEYYHPETGLPPPGAAPCQGWTAATVIDLAIRRSRGEI
ncbi:MAG: hypothetical protein QN210_04320 [Armatimonadota bacterium]|nr:hypothetical protein [Armatimonadota bacterium]MDR7587953.1 hypothetical protein [Armatimonadota bacterium]MDR7611628.1 hypothetical protein [Armatimonadota bacterium]